MAGARCPACQCSRCGKASDRGRWGVCPACDAADLALAESGDAAAVQRRLGALRHENDSRRRICHRCGGFGATEVSGRRSHQVIATCPCNDGRVRDTAAPIATEARREIGMLEVKQGNLIATDYRAMWTQRFCAGWLPAAKVVQRYAKEFGMSTGEAERAVDQLIETKYLRPRDREQEGNPANLFDGDAFREKQAARART